MSFSVSAILPQNMAKKYRTSDCQQKPCELGSPSCFFFRSLHSPCWDEGTTNFTSLKISLLNKNLLLSWWVYDVACENNRFSSLFAAGDVCSTKLRGTVILFNELKRFLSLNCFNVDHLLLNFSRPRLVISLWQELVTTPFILTESEGCQTYSNLK